MKPTIRLGRIGGIELGIHYSWFAVLALAASLLATGVLPEQYPGWSAGAYWATGSLAALMLFVSIAVHELAHSKVAGSLGFPVQGITLFILGVSATWEKSRDGPGTSS